MLPRIGRVGFDQSGEFGNGGGEAGIGFDEFAGIGERLPLLLSGFRQHTLRFVRWLGLLHPFQKPDGGRALGGRDFAFAPGFGVRNEGEFAQLPAVFNQFGGNRAQPGEADIFVGAHEFGKDAGFHEGDEVAGPGLAGFADDTREIVQPGKTLEAPVIGRIAAREDIGIETDDFLLRRADGSIGCRRW